MPDRRRSMRRRGCGPCAPCGISFASVAAWRRSLIPLVGSRCIPARPTGLALGHLLVLRHGVVLHDLALEDPDLDAAGAVGRERGGNAVIDVGAQRVQRHAAFAIPLHARDLGAAETAGAIDADAERAETHPRLHRAL